MTKRQIPFQLDSLDPSDSTWRATLRWPVAFADSRRRLLALRHAYFKFLMGVNNVDSRNALLLSLDFGVAAAVLEAAACVEREPATGVELYGTDDLAYLRNGAADRNDPKSDAVTYAPPRASARALPLRRLVRIASWSPWWRVPRAFLKPDVEALSHNSLLRAEAARANESIGFRHGDDVLRRVLAETSPSLLTPIDDDLGRRLTRHLAAAVDLDPGMRKKAVTLIEPYLCRRINEAAHTLAVLREARHLPTRLWSATGGKFEVRALGIEILRRGGDAIRFDHGGTVPLMAEPDALALQELAVSSRVVMATPQAAAMPVVTAAQACVREISNAEIDGGGGDPGLDPGPDSLRRRAPKSSRRRVIYVPTALYGYSQTFPPVLPDIVYLDWQLRLVEKLRDMSVDLLCKPHPEGVGRKFQGLLSALAPTTDRPFEEVMAAADLFVFDYAATTTFSIAVCTDRPIVYVDLGTMAFNDPARQMVERRCRIVPVAWGDDHLPRVDEEQLAQAVCTGPTQADASEFRALYLRAKAA